MKLLLDENIQSEVRSVNFMDVGIHSNVELTEVKVETSPKGNHFIAFTFTSPEGKVLTKTEWPPMDNGDDENMLKKAQNQLKRIKHIMTKFLPEDQIKIEYDTDNWIKFASTVKAKLDPVMQGIKLRIKGVYDNNNYVTLPNYLPFIERMDVEKSELEILSIDKVTKDEPDQEVPVTNKLEEIPTQLEPEKEPDAVDQIIAEIQSPGQQSETAPY